MTGEQRDGKLRNRASRGATAKSSARYTSDSVFINIELDKEQTGQYRTWREDIENVVLLWTELLEEGYRVNSKYDDYSSSCAVFIIPDGSSENSGYILTGRGGNPYRALAEAIFKHREILRGDWSTHQDGPKWSDDPDF